MFRISLKSIIARKARLLLTSLAVILGTAFLAGTSIFSATLNSTFNNLFSDVFKGVDAYVRSSQVIQTNFGEDQRQRIPVTLVDAVRRVPGVADVGPDLQAFARIVGTDGKPLGADGNGPPTFGSVVSGFTGSTWSIAKGRLPHGPTEMAMDEASFKKGKFTLGGQAKVVAQSGSREFTVVGVASYGKVRSPGGATFALFDQPTASEFLAKPGFVDNIQVKGDGSKSDEQLAKDINSALPASSKTETLTGAEITAETQSQIGKALNFFGILLQTFSFIALGVGAFVIYNVFSISAAQRQRENALLRAIGASKRQVTNAMLIESVVVGLVGSVAGLFGGIGLTVSLKALLKALNVDIPSQGLVLGSGTVPKVIITGLLVTVVSALLPARRAGRVPPLAAMRETAFESTTIAAGRARRISGLVLLLAGLGVIVAVTAGASNSFLGLGILLVFVATIVLGPVIAKPVAQWLGVPVRKVRGVTGLMAQENSTRNPKRTSRTAAPVLIGVALVTAVTALASSITGQINDVFTAQFKGDYTISTENRGSGGLSPTLEDDIAKLPEVERATGIGLVAAKVGTGTGNTGQFVTYINPDTITGVYELGMVEGDAGKLTTDGVLISQKNARNNGYTIGSTIPMVFADGSTRQLTVQGIYANDDLVRKFVVSRHMLESTTVQMFDFGIYIKVKPGQDSTATRAALQAAVDKYGQGKLLNKKEFIKQASGNVQQLLGLIYGLLMLSIIIAVLGIIITLLLSVFERQREIGLLRAVGMTKGQVRTTVRWESVITSLIGAVMGIVLGIGLGWVIVFALRDNGLSNFQLPIGSTIFILIMSFVVGILAAVYPAWRATKVDILAALVTN